MQVACNQLAAMKTFVGRTFWNEKSSFVAKSYYSFPSNKSCQKTKQSKQRRFFLIQDNINASMN